MIVSSLVDRPIAGASLTQRTSPAGRAAEFVHRETRPKRAMCFRTAAEIPNGERFPRKRAHPGLDAYLVSGGTWEVVPDPETMWVAGPGRLAGAAYGSSLTRVSTGTPPVRDRLTSGGHLSRLPSQP